MSVMERADPRRKVREVRKPAFVARAKIGNGWITIGAAWELRNGEGFSVKLNSIPVGGWEGQFVLIEPFQADTPPEE
jgi:hypothetical protein